jgi:ubiquinone/menaquinone biosynthesis C-methylase UbiE
MAADFPECEFLGIDIAPLQPTTVLPKNCSFELVNVLEGIPRPDNYFDYVRHRLLVAAMPADKWMPYIQECVRICAPGGWIEMVETDAVVIDGGDAVKQINDWGNEGFKKRGIDTDIVNHLDELLREAGLTNVTKQTFVGPIGAWGGPAGELLNRNFQLLSSSVQPLITNVVGVPKEEYERMVALGDEESKTHQRYTNINVYLGQKQ